MSERLWIRDKLKIQVFRILRKALFAHAVVAKGAGEDGFAVQCLVDDVVGIHAHHSQKQLNLQLLPWDMIGKLELL